MTRIPKGFRRKPQGCEERATLGARAEESTTLKGLQPTRPIRKRCHFRNVNPEVIQQKQTKQTKTDRKLWGLPGSSDNPIIVETLRSPRTPSGSMLPVSRQTAARRKWRTAASRSRTFH